MKGLFPLLVIGAISADYALTGDKKPWSSSLTVPSSEQVWTTGQTYRDGSAEESPVVVEVPDTSAIASSVSTVTPSLNGSITPFLFDPSTAIPKPAKGIPEGLTLSRPELAGNIDRGVEELDAGMRKLPGYVIDYAKSVEKHGLKAFLYDDLNLKRAGQAIGEQIGTGIQELAAVVGKDMIAGAQEAKK